MALQWREPMGLWSSGSVAFTAIVPHRIWPNGITLTAGIATLVVGAMVLGHLAHRTQGNGEIQRGRGWVIRLSMTYGLLAGLILAIGMFALGVFGAGGPPNWQVFGGLPAIAIFAMLASLPHALLGGLLAAFVTLKSSTLPPRDEALDQVTR